MKALDRYWEISKHGLGRPEHTSAKEYRQFLRRVAACVLFGHKETLTIHRYSARGQRSRVEHRSVCSRCGVPFGERRSKAVQFPRPLEQERWKR